MGGRNIADATRGDDEDEEMPTRTQQPPPSLDWKKLGRKASVAFRRAPNVDFMYVQPSVVSGDTKSAQSTLSYVIHTLKRSGCLRIDHLIWIKILIFLYTFPTNEG